MIEARDIRTGEIVKMPTLDERAAALLEELEEKDRKRKELEPKVIPRAKFYKKAIEAALSATLLGSIIIAILTFILIKKPIDVDIYIIIAGTIMLIGIISLISLGISHKLWERRLAKVGLYTPLELE